MSAEEEGFMKHRITIVRSMLPLALVLMFAAPTPAHALGDWIGVEGALWRNGQVGSASIDGDALSGSTVDFQDTLDLDKNDNSKMGRAWLHWRRTRLYGAYYAAPRKGSTPHSQSCVLEGT